ncbi:hypothetical protein GGQ61_002736 [Phenylobacterium haematophilum]|uniref:DUF2804 domain-containing protein n=1 Tax=Phenylobacterium haematophilum TaxID=98513 RepID=A0A840A0T6_9CAUL|nr:DUF2804 domain-containing protein [Phenylobacterium haematophilum]MBB3892008.1 hypothetical protein [Phenylobacterium haematophilum]
MQKLMGSGELLDAKGHLVERGWAASEVRRYDRAAIGVAHDDPAIKEWDYYAILTPDFGLALTVADNGHMGFLGVSWMDFQARRFVNGGVGLPAPHGAMNLPSSADAGDIAHVHPKMEIAFRFAPGGRVLTVDAPDFDKGAGISGEIVLAQPPMDRMVIATPFAEQASAFYYNQKINCMPASGHVIYAGQRYQFAPTSAFAVLDWGRGVWTYDNTWYWGSASGLVDGKPFGFNIGYGFGDTSAASENVLFYDGKAHKLTELQFHLPDGAHDSGPWRFTSSDGRFEMTFEPIVDRHADFAMGPVSSRQHQVFGKFSGVAVLDDGTRLQVRDLIGFAEEVENHW